MLLFFMGTIKELFERGRDYVFPRPSRCLKEGCGSGRIWSHGYVDAYFEGYAAAFSMKRYICAECGCVYRLRPLGYWPRHHVPARFILGSLCHRIRQGVWGDRVMSRQRQGHWLRSLGSNIKTHLGVGFGGDLLEGFHELLACGLVPVRRPLY